MFMEATHLSRAVLSLLRGVLNMKTQTDHAQKTPSILTSSNFSPWIYILNEVYNKTTSLQQILSAQ